MALGKSLNNILEDYFGNDEVVTESYEIKQIAVEDIIIGPYQTRKEFDPESLRALSESIKTTGLIAPIIVHINEEGKYVLLAGERRLRATKMAQLNSIEAKIIGGEGISEEKKVFLTAYENLLREDLNPMELARTYKLLIEKNNLSLDDLAHNIGKSAQYVRNYLKLLELSEPVKQLLEQKKLTEGQARHIHGLRDEDQLSKAQDIISGQVSVRSLEKEKRIYKRKMENPNYEEGNYEEDDSFILDHPMFEELKKFKEKFPYAHVDFNGNLRKGKITITFSK
ncbi:MAG: ParB/RepB/Spo0J family partition protein [Patescibacteria group bacterium]